MIANRDLQKIINEEALIDFKYYYNVTKSDLVEMINRNKIINVNVDNIQNINFHIKSFGKKYFLEIVYEDEDKELLITSKEVNANWDKQKQ